MTNGIQLLTGIVEGIKAIVRLRKDARSDEKVALQIKRLERQLRSEQSRIQPARLQDVRKFDPKVRQLLDSLRDGGSKPKPKRSTKKRR